MSMEIMRLKDMPLSMRISTGLLLCVVGVNYLFFLAGIWIDTRMDVANIIEGYASFEFSELAEHSFKYLSWFLMTFGITGLLFLLTSRPEMVKMIFAVVVPLLIISDIGSMWLVRYSGFFAWQLFFSGFFLAACFLVMFLVIQYDLWRRN